MKTLLAVTALTSPHGLIILLALILMILAALSVSKPAGLNYMCASFACLIASLLF